MLVRHLLFLSALLFLTSARLCPPPATVACELVLPSASNPPLVVSGGRVCACVSYRLRRPPWCPTADWTCDWFTSRLPITHGLSVGLVTGCWCVRRFKPVTAAPSPAPTPAPTAAPDPIDTGPAFLYVDDGVFRESQNFGVRLHNLTIEVRDYSCASGFGAYPLCLKEERRHVAFGRGNCPPVWLTCEQAARVAVMSRLRARAWFNSSSACVFGNMRRSARGFSQNCNTISGSCANSVDTGSGSLHPTTYSLWTLCHDTAPPRVTTRVVARVVDGVLTPVDVRNPNTLRVLSWLFELPVDPSGLPIAAFVDSADLTPLLPTTDPPRGEQVLLPDAAAWAVSSLQQLEANLPTNFPTAWGDFAIVDLSHFPLLAGFTPRSDVVMHVERAHAWYRQTFGFIGGPCAYELDKGGFWCLIVPPVVAQRVRGLRLTKQRGQQGVPGCTALTIPSRYGYGRGTSRKFDSVSTAMYTTLGPQHYLLPNCTKTSVTKFPGVSASTTSGLVESYCDPTRALWWVFGVNVSALSGSASPGRLSPRTMPPCSWEVHTSLEPRCPQYSEISVRARSPVWLGVGSVANTVWYRVDPNRPLILWRVARSCQVSPLFSPVNYSDTTFGTRVVYRCVLRDFSSWENRPAPSSYTRGCASLTSPINKSYPTFYYLNVTLERCYNVSALMERVCSGEEAALTQLLQLITQLYPPLANYSSFVQQASTVSAEAREASASARAALVNATQLLAAAREVFSKASSAVGWEPDTPTLPAAPDYTFWVFLGAAVSSGVLLALIFACAIPGIVAYRKVHND